MFIDEKSRFTVGFRYIGKKLFAIDNLAPDFIYRDGFFFVYVQNALVSGLKSEEIHWFIG